MTADASQAALPLGWFLLLAASVFVVCGLLWLFADGAERIDAALAQLDDDDEPVPYLPTDVCTDPDCGCEQAREVARGHLRLFRAMQEQAAWEDRLRAVARADAEAAGVRDGGR